MKIILLKDVPKVGRKDDIIDVNQGYAFNMLIPKKLARPATPTDIANVSNKKESNKKHEEEKRLKAVEMMKSLHGQTVTINEKANEKGHLFSKVQVKEILEAIKKQFAFDINQNWILNFEPIKSVGEYLIQLEAFGEKSTFLLNVNNR